MITFSFKGADQNGNPNVELSKIALITNSVSTNTLSISGCAFPNTPLKKSTPNKRPKRPESSKFNRSVVSSKNCATYYFKHMDTDPDTAPDGWSSQDASEAYSEEEPWVYAHGNSDAMSAAKNEDEQNENNISINMANLSMQVHCNESISIDVIDGNIAEVQYIPIISN